jgi:hypothetical protein
MTGGQVDLFGNPVVSLPEQRQRRAESNDVDLMHTVAANAVRCDYLLVGTSERVYARVADQNGEVQRVPRYEEDAVHQLLRRRWLTTGSHHDVTCGAASLHGAAVLVPKETRSRVERWNRLQRPPSWPRSADPGDPAVPTSGRVVRLHDRKKRR